MPQINCASGIFQIMAVSFATGAIILQIIALGGNSWYVSSLTVQGYTTRSHFGLFMTCASQDSSNEWVCSKCETVVSAFESDRPWCVVEKYPYDGPKLNDLLPQIRGTQALAIMTILVAIGNLAVVLLFVCDKIKSAVPAFASAAFTSAGAVATFVLFYTMVNNKCSRTYCEKFEYNYNVQRAAMGNAVDNPECKASYGPYLEMLSAPCMIVAAVSLCFVNRSRTALARAEVEKAQKMLDEATS